MFRQSANLWMVAIALALFLLLAYLALRWGPEPVRYQRGEKAGLTQKPPGKSQPDDNQHFHQSKAAKGRPALMSMIFPGRADVQPGRK